MYVGCLANTPIRRITHTPKILYSGENHTPSAGWLAETDTLTLPIRRILTSR